MITRKIKGALFVLFLNKHLDAVSRACKMCASIPQTVVMRASASLPLVLAAFLLSLLPPATRASEVCSSAKSTVEETGCVIAALKAMDQRLEQALEAVALEALEVPSEVFQTLWRDNLTGFYKTSTDPSEQAATFRDERRKVCAYAKSVAFQGTGYGIFTTRCELALTRTLLDQLQP